MDVINQLTSRERAAVNYALALLGTDTYFQRYYQLLSGDFSSEEAFVQLEGEVKALTGRSRYEDYQSFRNMRWRYCTRLGLRK